MAEQESGGSRRFNHVHFGTPWSRHVTSAKKGGRVMEVNRGGRENYLAKRAYRRTIGGLISLECQWIKPGSSMKNNSYLEIDHSPRRAKSSVWSLAIAIAVGAYGAGGITTLHAQSTTGRIFGSAPAGQTITVHGTSGAHRHSKANAQGRYTIASLPMGTYTVTLEKDEKAVDTRSNIGLTVGGGAEVDFACVHDQCAESANN
jgi:hypothetical protein